MFKIIYLLLMAISWSAAQADNPVFISSTTTLANPTIATELLDAKSDDVYYRFSRRDYRKCMYPMCGGFYVKAVNSPKTLCADNKWRAECYVAELDGQLLEWDEDAQAKFFDSFEQERGLIRGQLFNAPYQETVAVRLTVSEAWESATGKTNPPGAASKYYLVKDNGIRCITTPCDNLDISLLNDAKSKKTVSDINLSASGATEDMLNQAYEKLGGSGLIIAGHDQADKKSGKGPSKTRQLVAETFYWSASDDATTTPPTPEGEMCGGIQGLSCAKGQVCDITMTNACSGADLTGVCITPPEMCIQEYNPVCGCDGKTYSNNCERQAVGVQLDYVGKCEKGRDVKGNKDDKNHQH